ncbi:unnamed protein product [Scytosiphon promiscuus]
MRRRQYAAGVASVTRSSNPLRAWARAKIVLRNESDYRVSYWVLHEDRLAVSSAKRRVFRNMEDFLNDGGADTIIAKRNNAKHGRDMINAENALDQEYFVMRDYRPDPGSGVKVRFPKGCRHLRVYAYAWFKNEQEWRVIKDKICKNGRFTRFTISATNETVEPFEL